MLTPQSVKPVEIAYCSIKSIHTKNLFGHYSYSIHASSKENPLDHPHLLILYGDNGCGKTTILKLILHTLSPIPNKGHRTFIARTRFERFGVELENNTIIEAIRPKGKTEGSFRMRIRQGKTIIAEARFVVDDYGNITNANAPHNKDKLSLYRHLRALVPEFHYLSDDRSIESSVTSEIADEEEIVSDSDDSDELSRRAVRHVRTRRNRLPALDLAINSAVQWFREHALKGADTGSAQANTIYTEIIKQIARHGEEDVATTNSADELQAVIANIAKRNENFSRFGLSTPLEISELQSAIASARKSNQRLIRSILQPYLNGVTARLDALQDLLDVIQTFTDSLNSFYQDKAVNLDLQRGLTIATRGGTERLSPQNLSSGEKQLLLLLCNVLSARDRASVFIIDEPEISLNIKWQRRLIAALLACMAGSRSQLIIATHSMELLAQYRHDVVRLYNAPTATTSG